MAEKPPEESYISVVDEEPEIFELLKWDSSHTQNTPHKQQHPLPIEKPRSPEKRPQKPRECDPFDLQEPAFIETYRLSKDLVRTLCEDLKPCMPITTKSIEFSIESKVLAALAYYATGKYQKSIGGKTDPTITQYFVSTAVMQVTEALNHHSFISKYIHFPHLKAERDFIKARFYMKYGIPNVLGCVDCMHVPIARPEDGHKDHFNKSYHSMKVQIICDSDLTILSVDTTPGGAYSHDAILNRHPVKVDLDSLNKSGEQCWLIGGPHYTQKLYIMTPIQKITKKSPVSPEKYYSNIHAQTHNAVVDTIKQIKTRWKCLQATCNKPNQDPATVTMIIVACCILNNICNARALPIVPMTQTEERLEAMKQKVANGPIPRKQVIDENSLQARARLVERLWSERRVTPECGPKKRMAKKDRPLQVHQPVMETPPPPPPPQQMHQIHHEDYSKRPRLLPMNTPTYGIGMPPGWGHYPQH